MTLRPAVGNLRRETARYGGLLNLLAAGSYTHLTLPTIYPA